VVWPYKQWRQEGAIEQVMLAPKPSAQEKALQGKSGLVPVPTRWIIERSNAWMERCKRLVKNFERTLGNATAKLNLCFIRLMLKRLARA
jgi:transposase